MHPGESIAKIKFAVIDKAGSGDNELIAAVAGKKLRVLAYVLVSGGTVTVRFESAAGGTALTGQMTTAVNNIISSGYSPVGHFETIAGEALNLELGGAVTVDGHLVFQEV